MDLITNELIVQSIQDMKADWHLRSLLVNYPDADHLSLFFIDREGWFCQRIIRYPDGEITDKRFFREHEKQFEK